MSAKLGAINAGKPYSIRAHGACSLLEPQPKFPLVRSIVASRYLSMFSTKSRLIGRSVQSIPGSPRSRYRQVSKRYFPKPVFSTDLRNCLGMIASVSTSALSRGATTPLCFKKFSMGLMVVPLSYIDEFSGHSRRRCHDRTDEMRSPKVSLTPFKISVGG